MKPPQAALLLIACLGLAAVALGEVASTACAPRSCCTCPDDYCAKPLPCVPCAPRGCVDDFCAKSMPCVACAPRGCVDCYCPKPFNFCLPPCYPAWYTCGCEQCHKAAELQK